MDQLCAHQPHPLYFVWFILIAGLIRSRTSLAQSLTARCILLWHTVDLVVADTVSFSTFAVTVSAGNSLNHVSGIVNAWLISQIASYPLRAWAAWRATTLHQPNSSRLPTLHDLLPVTPNDYALGVLTAAAVSSSLVLVLANALLKFELQERGASLEAACYSWHVATFFIGAAFAPACGPGVSHHEGSVHEITRSNCSGGCAGRISGSVYADDDGIYQDGGGNAAATAGTTLISCSIREAGLHGVALVVITSRHAAALSAPLAASSVVVGGLGVLPQDCCRWYVRHVQRRPRTNTLRDGGGRVAKLRAALIVMLICFCTLCAYVATVRALVAPSATSGPFVIATCGEEFAGPQRSVDSAAMAALAADEEYDEDEVERITIGKQWTLLGFMYGRRTVAVPFTRCNGALATSAVGLVLAVDGSQAKYADAVYVALHNVRKLQRCTLPAEILHVGKAERFEAAAVLRIGRLGGVN